MTQPDAETLAFYDRAAQDYAERLASGSVRPRLLRFMDRIPAGGRVLDLGCGPGNASAAMAERGLFPDPVDASAGMVAFARDTYGVPARAGTFDTDFGTATYDGIWASYSLLHAARPEIPDIITRLAAALRPGGPFYVGMKLGTGELRDDLGRFYTLVEEDELTGWVTGAGLKVIEADTGKTKGMAGTVDPCIDLMAERPLA